MPKRNDQEPCKNMSVTNIIQEFKQGPSGPSRKHELLGCLKQRKVTEKNIDEWLTIFSKRCKNNISSELHNIFLGKLRKTTYPPGQIKRMAQIIKENPIYRPNSLELDKVARILKNKQKK
jgi:hypothetical protein